MKPESIIVNVSRYINGNYVDVPETAVLIKIENHDVYVLESSINGTNIDYRNEPDYTSNVYREDGSIIRCAWVFGRTGKAHRWAYLRYHTQKRFIIQTTNGLNGATWHGSGARLAFVDWNGDKYEKALAESERTGKKLLHA